MIVVIHDFLSPDECDNIVACFPRAAPPGEVDHGSGATVSNVRKSKVSFLPSGVCGDIVARVYKKLMDINGRHFHYDIAGCEPLQLAEYGVGESYGDHLDTGPGTASLRKLSASVQLSSPHDYDGGDLAIFGASKIDRERGTLVVFPSWSVHSVAPVTRGVRRSLVAWAFGLRPFR